MYILQGNCEIYLTIVRIIVKWIDNTCQHSYILKEEHNVLWERLSRCVTIVLTCNAEANANCWSFFYTTRPCTERKRLLEVFCKTRLKQGVQVHNTLCYVRARVINGCAWTCTCLTTGFLLYRQPPVTLPRLSVTLALMLINRPQKSAKDKHQRMLAYWRRKRGEKRENYMLS